MSNRKPLPPQLIDVPFRTRDASRFGISRSRLRAADLAREVRGVRMTAGELTLSQRCALVQTRMPTSSAFSHETAALLHGMPVPVGSKADRTLHVAVPNPSRAPHARGIVGHKLMFRAGDVITLPSGIRVTSPVRTWLDLGASARLTDLVAAGDFLIHHRRAVATQAELERALRVRRSRRGSATLYRALQLLDDHAESAPESILRVLVELAGLPRPRANVVVSGIAGEFIARTDLLLEESRVVLEYMGDYHRTTQGQWRADMTRRSRLEAAGFRVMDLNANDLRNPLELANRIRSFALATRQAPFLDY